ncbi:MAG: hypothetical protein ACO1RX_22955 [Candidatus Sericytochromatia bacterium]
MSAPTMPLERVSFRHHLDDAISRFLGAEIPAYLHHNQLLTELIVALSEYREEGTHLYPAVFICERREELVDVLGGKDLLPIGVGPVSRYTLLQALKQCAPLAQRRQWAIYLTLGERMGYGVFRTESSPLNPTTFGNLRNLQRPDLNLLGLVQVGDNVIEMRASNGQGIYLYLSGSRPDARSPAEVIGAFSQAVSAETPPELVQPVRDFYYRILIELSRGQHGALVAVLPLVGGETSIFTDGVLLTEPVSVPETMAAYLANPGVEEAARLQAQASLIRGMLSCDGITLFRADGTVLGYHVFLQSLTMSHSGLGGARRRAFDALSRYVGHGLSLAMYRSQDGAMEYTENNAARHKLPL